ncbi:CDGSH iron-sulfur domain-containing protein 3, mitochondrial [Centruroides vittatus]|uniref:CDGSH iron-sulfur domain-containing protein 3, mitochondrial n=1 Tax=Centruroides vittatus TaxID=120091 RepID=UPI00350FBBCA
MNTRAFSTCIRLSNIKSNTIVQFRNYKKLSVYETPDIPELQDLPERQYYDSYHQTEKGKVYDVKPFKFLCKAGRAYDWCPCGHSRNQPFCDGTCKNERLRITMKPIRFICRSTREYWFCNCKQTEHRPFCDGSHKNPEVQNSTPTVKPPRL